MLQDSPTHVNVDLASMSCSCNNERKEILIYLYSARPQGMTYDCKRGVVVGIHSKGMPLPVARLLQQPTLIQNQRICVFQVQFDCYGHNQVTKVYLHNCPQICQYYCYRNRLILVSFSDLSNNKGRRSQRNKCLFIFITCSGCRPGLLHLKVSNSAYIRSNSCTICSQRWKDYGEQSDSPMHSFS